MKELFKSVFQFVTPTLREKGMSDTEIEQLKKSVQEEMKKVDPPKIAIIGFTGVGKSSTINALFNAGQEISDVRACTKEEKMIFGDITEYTGSKGKVVIYDMPGLGEDIDADQEHLNIYRRVLPIVDVVVWTFQAGDRAMAPMQNAMIQLQHEFGNDLTKKLVFAVNKADVTAPGETSWNIALNLPSQEQKSNIDEFEKYVFEKIRRVLPNWKGHIVTYSAKRRYRLDMLMTTIIEAVPLKRRWVYDQCADVADFTQMIDPKYINYVHSLMREKRE
ncbi:MAG: 50S ribosome-binding GTPase [Eubacteriales bacterium]|nr:50S ribosome-binding GTPase [Eubacteriales bacterium]